MGDEFFHGGNIGPLSTKTIAGFQKGLNTGPLNESWIVSGSFAKRGLLEVLLMAKV